MTITSQTLPIDRIQPHPANNNGHPDAQIASLRRSLGEFGYVRSAVVQAPADPDSDYLIIAGEGIVTAAKQERYAELECRVIPADWPPEKVLAYLVADNELGRQSALDDGKTAAILAQLKKDGAGELVAAAGFSDHDAAAIIADVEMAARGNGRAATPELPPDVELIETAAPELKAPFPWFGGKRLVSAAVWQRFGDVVNYVEPFAGSLAVLLNRPTSGRTETVNDKDAYLANFWRALQHDPQQVAHYCDWPVNEIDLHARHQWLIDQVDFREQLRADPEFYDCKIAGWWVWGLCAWIGGGWCDTTAQQMPNMIAEGVPRHALRDRVPHMADAGRGVHRAQLSRQRPHLRPAQGVQSESLDLYGYMDQLAARLRYVRVCCGDWSRIVTPSVTFKIGTTAVFLDPPYAADRAAVYAEDDFAISTAVREWCLETITDEKEGFSGPRYRHPKLRIALCGYEHEHGPHMPSDWTKTAWNAGKGYAGQRKDGENDNGRQERIWFSPHCLRPEETAT